MDVYVDILGRERDKEYGGGFGVTGAARVGVAQRGLDGRGGGRAAVDEDVVRPARRECAVRPLHKARDTHIFALVVHAQEGIGKIVAEKLANAHFGGLGGGKAADFARIDDEREGDTGVGEGVYGVDVAHMRFLGGV